MNSMPQKETFDVQELLKELTLEEKASLCSGKDAWNTKSIKRFDIPSLLLSDGPHGLRKVLKTTNLLKTQTSLSTCFPTSSALGASWNKQLIYEVGCALGRECNSEGVNILLGPGINMKRTPLCGRNFEYFSEDPYHTAECAIAYIRGVQDQGVGTSLKHFACNNQEYMRFSIDAIVDERTLRELYLRAFEIVVKAAGPWTVMSSYNSLNGKLLTENRRFLVDILKTEWGFKGLVVSDWGSIYDRVKALKAGCELEMPGKDHRNDMKIIKAVESGEMDEKYLDESVASFLSLLNVVYANKKESTGYKPENHHALARKAALESIVLLKNDAGILPINRETVKSIAVIGAFAGEPRLQGRGSSFVNAAKIDIPLKEIRNRAGETIQVQFARGYTEENEEDTGLVDQATETAKNADLVIIFAGIYDNVESEGLDRTHLDLPVSHNLLITRIAEVNENTIVLLSNGSAVRMPWHGKVKAILETWLSGQAQAGAIADILFGIENPSGKLSESFPLRLEDTPAFLNYPGDDGKVTYSEGLYIGYRYYDKRKMDVLFPFGFGLSYTTFEYSDLDVNPAKINDTGEAMVYVTVQNTGDMSGKEVVQLYIRDIESTISVPEKELKGFEKIGLAPGEKTRITFSLKKDSFTHYDVKRKKWCVESGEFEILVGSSSRDIRLKKRIYVETMDRDIFPFTPHSYLRDFLKVTCARNYLRDWLLHKTGGRDDLDSFDAESIKKIQTIPLSKFAIFMPETVTDEELDEVVDKINESLRETTDEHG